MLFLYADDSPLVTLHLTVLVPYSAGLLTLGLVIGRQGRDSADVFVAGRRLGPGLIFSTMRPRSHVIRRKAT